MGAVVTVVRHVPEAVKATVGGPGAGEVRAASGRVVRERGGQRGALAVPHQRLVLLGRVRRRPARAAEVSSVRCSSGPILYS